MWDGTSQSVSNSFNVSLNAKQAKLFRLTLTSTPPSPKFNTVMLANGNQLIFSGTNGIGGWPYYLVAGTNLLTPLSQWPVIATNQFDEYGNLNFTTAIDPNTPQQFYLLEMP